MAYCGLDCAGCEAYQATLAGDEAVKHAIWEKWKAAYHAPKMPFEAVTCDGCMAWERMGGYCSECPVRACGLARSLPNCAHCEDFKTCGTLQNLIGEIPGVKENLAAIRVAL